MNQSSIKKNILERYASLLQKLDEKCAEVYAAAPEIPCKNKCFDCCKQLFPLSFVEAFYISEGLKTLDRSARRKLQKTAEKINNKILAANPLQFERRSVDRKTALNTHEEFARFLHEIACDCPALNPQNEKGCCLIYEFRNHDCRTMGASFDSSQNTIVGYPRFARLGYIIPKLMPFNYLYPEKMALDRKLITEITNSLFTPNILYYTTICGPFMKDYSEIDWIKFFAEKKMPGKAKNDEYWVTIDA